MKGAQTNEVAAEFHFATTRDGEPISGRIGKLEGGQVFVSLCPPFQYFGGWDPLADGEDVRERGRALFEQLVDTWTWLRRTPEILADRDVLLRELASSTWFVSEQELARRLGGCFDDDGRMLVAQELWAEISRGWDAVASVGERYLEDRVLALARAHGCPHSQRLWQVWDVLDLAPHPLAEEAGGYPPARP